ncbi:hypothetical protein BHE74_00005310 [Ensete ventricosum]|nr:hypothetical protein BHE74_00005310 [Ensete ventricosum]RZR85618.1 hypothetical protein BHM03_00012636 [Ensete ventricosum]
MAKALVIVALLLVSGLLPSSPTEAPAPAPAGAPSNAFPGWQTEAPAPTAYMLGVPMFRQRDRPAVLISEAELLI